ncbi:D-2-hydroxyacid dehydrogenase [Campylobacter ureolyticus]|uniref:D-2-hydroxyacid dehydrogenase n=1 Tax=Campylobacter ureolyticus TaxID=827 RepID=UPI0022B4B330|nr:D-2-hydroxyacid dehydrogenase [Campylobacter ureolyticus]MCZ6105007.1 D-2-hydroxyacid dehydrogenase [Campylobacter ureolyticus]MCZ6157961.1 D-2-hydroxyacid dehydrogenase [Campylobacter ureolyticus]
MKIVCLDALTLGDIDLSIFDKFGEFKSYDNTSNLDPNLVIERLKDADIVVVNKVLITKEIMQKTNLKLICISATGMNNVDLKAAKELKIEVKNVAGYSTNSVIQQTFASLFTLLNNTIFYSDYVKSGKWAKSEIFTNLDKPIVEIYGKKFGIIGLGEIGQGVARIAKSFGAEVAYYSTSGKNKNDEFKSVLLDEMLKNFDIISIHAPLNENTKNLIGKNELNKMKNGAVLMNFGRGGIVDEKALAKIVDEKDIKAILDVLEVEPMIKNHPLLNVKNKNNVLITPHVAWGSKTARDLLIKKIYLNIENFLKNR